MTTVVITQPMLFPWPGFFEQLQLADVYIYLDDVQFSKGSFTNRVQLMGHDHQRWLTVPLDKKGAFQKIYELRAISNDWRTRHENLLTSSTRGAPWALSATELLRDVYAILDLPELLIASIEKSASALGIGQKRRVLKASELNVGGHSWQRVLDLVRAVNGTRYVTGHGAAQYLDHEAFEAAGVEVDYVDYSLTTWPRGGSRQSPYISVLDLVAWTGADAAKYLHSSLQPWREFIALRTSKVDKVEFDGVV